MEPRRGIGFGGVVLAAVVVIGLAAASGIIPFRQVIAYQRSVDLAREQRDALIAANAELEQQIAALETDGEVERLAREQFGLVMPGETALVAIAVPDTSPVAAPRASRFVDETPWWRSLWAFITGEDLAASDG
ncbi:MAG: septum formation initiator family protein [Acidimicrobiia bacterium]|nr:septum formation initiator family protein [Acidimicrobiia bacterium]